jgi:hypothetical protein
VYVHAPHARSAAVPPVEDWDFSSLAEPALEGLAREEAAPLAMALCAA